MVEAEKIKDVANIFFIDDNLTLCIGFNFFFCTWKKIHNRMQTSETQEFNIMTSTGADTKQ